MGKIPRCPFATALILDWKEVHFRIKWAPHNPRANSLHQESLYWSVVFDNPLACQEPIKAYNLSKMDIREIDYVVDDQGHLLTFPQAMAACVLGMHHTPIWRKIWDMLQPFLHTPSLSHDHRLADWTLCPAGLNIHPVHLCKLTSIITYRLL